MMTQQVARYDARPTAISAYNEEEVELLKTQIAPGTTDKELAYFLTVSARRRLDPFRQQIYAIKRSMYDKAKGGYVEKMTIQVAHAGLLALAERTNGYRGTTEPQFAGEDGVWTDVWLRGAPPAACKVGVYRKGFAAPVVGVALWREYVQTGKDGTPVGLWKDKPTHMLEKCALSKALRRAFPDMEDAFVDEDHDAEPEEYVEAIAEPPRNLRTIPAIDEQPTAYGDKPTPDAVLWNGDTGEVFLTEHDIRIAPPIPEPITLTNDETGETIVVDVASEPAARKSGDDALKAAASKLKAKREPAAEAPTDDVTPMSALWARVQMWAKDHGTDPQRLRFYLATPAGVPERVGQDAMRAWLGSAPGNTLERLYELYVAGESGQDSADTAAAAQGGLGL